MSAAAPTRDQALALLRRNLSVIPVPRPRAGVPPGQPGDGKVPCHAWREFQSRLPTEDEVTAWFSGEPSNIAIVTGRVSGVVVVDADSQDALRWLTRRLPYSPWQVQTPRGFHVYYRCPEVRVGNRARVDTADGRVAIDVRGDGGFVIAAGSLHASGLEYREAGDWSEPREALPVFWPGWLERPTQRSSTAPRRREPQSPDDVSERARRYLAVIPRPQIGQGSDAAVLYAACRLTRGFELNAADATALLWEWGGGRPGWTREWVARKVAHAIRYGSEPMGALR